MPLLVQIIRQVGPVRLQKLTLTLDYFGKSRRQFRGRVQLCDGLVGLLELQLDRIEVHVTLLRLVLLAEQLVADVHFFV